MSIKERLHVMVVDDTSTSRGLMVQALESMGLRNVHLASNGVDALEKMQREPVHLVISDFNMPGMDGVELLQFLREHPPTRRIGFILITGRADREIIERGQAAGMNNFIRKPFTPPELKACLEAVLGRF